MIIDMPATSTRDINRRLVTERDEGGAIALGRVLTLNIDVDGQDAEEAIAAANDASREHPCRIIVLANGDHVGPARLDAQIRLGGDAGASEVIILRPTGELADHLDTLVIPMLLPDAPIVAWWPHEVPADPAQHPVGRMAQRRITDTTRCAHPNASLRKLAEVHAENERLVSGLRDLAARERGNARTFQRSISGYAPLTKNEPGIESRYVDGSA